MKINSRLKRSRHGVYYFRFVIPKHLRAQFNHKVEIKRSLGTKDPKFAHLCAYAFSLKLLAGVSIITLLNNNRQFIKEIRRECMANINLRGWTAVFPSGLKIEVDPNNPKDLESGERMVNDYNAGYETSITPTTTSIGGPKLSEKIDDWLQRLRTEDLRQKTIDEYESKFLVLVEFSNDIAISDFTAEHFSHFVNLLGSGKITNEPLSHATVNKYISAATSFFMFCQRINLWPQHAPIPTNGFRLGKHKKAKQKNHQPFSKNELLSIFDESQLTQLKQPHQYWVPLIALHTGARLEEICQLNVSDIYQDDNQVWIFDFNELDETKKLKTSAAHREVPVHSALLQLGLLDYLEFIKNHYPNESKLFPYLLEDKYERYGSNVSKWFGRHLDKINITDKEKVFHSLRSNFNNLLKINKVNEETRCQIIGHEHDTVNSRHYSNIHSNQWLLNNIFKKISYQYLNLTAFTFDQSKLKEQVDKLIHTRNSKLKNRLAKAKK